jgi:hypothetical protein
MRFLLPVFLVLAQSLAFAQTVGGPTQVQDPAYPIRISIFERTAHVHQGSVVQTWGRGNLFINQQEQGFDYQTDCSEIFMISHGDERYSGRWKKQGLEMEMLISKMGTGKSSKCVLKTDLKPFIYEFENGNSGPLITKPLPK